jgi:hypothetical protein
MKKEKTITTERKNKSLFLKFLFTISTITSAIVIAFATIFFIAPIFRKNDIAPARVFVYGDDLSVKAQEQINNAIASNIEKIYNQLITNIQFTIALFSCALVVFTIIFGFIYFSKVREAESLIKEIQKTPDLFFKQFYREQYNKNISNLFSTEYIKRYDAIKNLSYNPEINQDDYYVLKDVLQNEFNYDTNIYFYSNAGTLISVLVKIDQSRTISLLREILQEKGYDPIKHGSILQYIIADTSPETKKYLQEKLVNDPDMGIQLVSMLMSNGKINDYTEYILENCNGPVLQSIINNSTVEMWHIKTDNFYEHLVKRDDIDIQILHSLISNAKIDIEERVRLVLKFYNKDKEKYDRSLTTLIGVIKDDDSKLIFFDIIKECNYEKEINDFLRKNKHLKSYFPDIVNSDIIEQDIKNKKTSNDIINELGLYYNKDSVIVDKQGKSYDVKNYCHSFFGPMMEVLPGIMIDGIFIEKEKIKPRA